MRRCKEKLFCLAALLCMSLIMACPTRAEDNLYEQGLAEYKNHHYYEAVRLFEEYVSSQSTVDSPDKASMAHALFYQADCQEQLGNSRGATALYKSVIKQFANTKLAAEAQNALDQLTSSPGKHKFGGEEQPPVIPRNPALDFLPRETFVPFVRSGNLMLVQGAINGRPTGMLFDTGAGGCLFSTDHLKYLGLPLPTGKPNSAVAGVGARQQKAAWAMLADIRLGNMERRQFPVRVSDNPLNYPLLGMDFLQGLEFTVDSQEKVIRFRTISKEEKMAANGKTAVPAMRDPFSLAGSNMISGHPGDADSLSLADLANQSWRNLLPNLSSKMFITVDSSSHYVYFLPFCEISRAIIVMAKIGHKDCPVILDTGSDLCVFTTAQVAELGIQPRFTGQFLNAKGVGGRMRAPLYVFDQAEFGPIRGPLVCVISDQAYLPRPLLGQNYLRNWELTIDHVHQVIKFTEK